MSNERWHASITPLIISANGDLERPQLHTSTSLPCCLQSGASYSCAQPWPGCAAIFPSLSPSSSTGHAFNCLHSPVDLIVKVADFPPYLVYSLFVVSSLHLYLEAKPTFTRCDNRLCHSWLHDWLFKPNTCKSQMLSSLFGHLNLNLVRSNARAILSRSYFPSEVNV